MQGVAVDLSCCYRSRFTWLMDAIEQDNGVRNLRLEILMPREIPFMGNRYVGVTMPSLTTMFRPDEIDKLEKTLSRVDSLPQSVRRAVDMLAGARDDARGAEVTASEKSRMI